MNEELGSPTDLSKSALERAEEVIVCQTACVIVEVVHSKPQALHLLKTELQFQCSAKLGVHIVLDPLGATKLVQGENYKWTPTYMSRCALH